MMGTYLLRRLILLPITMFFIILINFVIINLAPGDPISITEISPDGMASRQETAAVSFGTDFRYLQFREHFGLTLPILFNLWPETSEQQIKDWIRQLSTRKYSPDDLKEIPFQDYEQLRNGLGDRARFIMNKLLNVANDSSLPIDERAMAVRFFVRGGTRQAYLGPNLSQEKKEANRQIAKDNDFLMKQMPSKNAQKINTDALNHWLDENKKRLGFQPTAWERVGIFFFETRFWKYMSRVVTLDFGVLRDDRNKTVTSEVVKRFKYSLTLSIIPMLLTFVLCQFIGFTMALKQNRWPDYSLNVTCLIFYALPIFVIAPFLIEKVALNNTFPFTHIPIPISGFTSPDLEYSKMTTWERLWDVIQHIALPITAILYGSLAAQSRLARTAVLEVLRQDYVRTAWAKGLSPSTIIVKHVGRNASITIVTSIATSLGVILGGSLIVETLFNINGFGKFFYDAIINRDYNVIMFSALAGSFLSLMGYLIADIAYTILDPRVTLD